jgi:hypothetical protein
MYKKVGNKMYCARGSGANKHSNLALKQDVIAGVLLMGPRQGKHGIWTQYNDWNESTKVTRLGATDYRTKNMESLALANLLAKQCQIQNLPFEHVLVPAVDSASPEECMGFDLFAGPNITESIKIVGDDGFKVEELNDNVDIVEADGSANGSSIGVDDDSYNSDDETVDASELESAEEIY